jgi:NADPH:quinone reductase-like Zn-dependent oxidoreductase
MKAAVFHDYGDPNVLRYEDVATPLAEPGHVLIKVLATGINRLEHYLREGSYSRTLLKLPHVLGSDAAGEVAALGAGVSRFRVGERVIPMPGYPLAEEDWDIEHISTASSYAVAGVLRPGTYAQFISVPERWVVKDTTGLPPELVATLPMVMVTAARALRSVGEVKSGDCVLVHAGASGTGSMAIQMARALNAKVAATIHTPGKINFARELGADLVIDVTKDDFVRRTQEWTSGRGVDVVIDNLGGSVLRQSLAAVKNQGIVVALGFVTGVEVSFNIRDFFFPQKQVRGSLMGSVADLEWGLKLVREGRIRPLLDRVLPLRDAAEAHRLLAANEVRGNVVLNPWA